MNHTFSILVKNGTGVLVPVVGFFTQNGLDIKSIAVGTTANETDSRITIVTDGEAETVQSVCENITQLPEVILARLLDEDETVSRELAFVKVYANQEQRGQLIQIAEIFRARIIDVSSSTITLETTGDESKVEALLNMLSDFSVCEVVRTGTIAISRGELILNS